MFLVFVIVKFFQYFFIYLIFSFPSFLIFVSRICVIGGVEMAFMSTTTNLAVAIEYAGRGDSDKRTIMEIPFSAASRGASVQWVSQYPYGKAMQWVSTLNGS